MKQEDKYPEIVGGFDNIEFPRPWIRTGISSAESNGIKYAWKSPSVKGDKFYGWIKIT